MCPYCMSYKVCACMHKDLVMKHAKYPYFMSVVSCIQYQSIYMFGYINTCLCKILCDYAYVMYFYLVIYINVLHSV